MGHPSLKKRSKRMLCRTRYKIEKKVREHNRKKKKEAKKNKGKKRPDLIIAPNLCPFKEQAINELNEAKSREKEVRLENLKLSEDVNMNSASGILEELIIDANERNKLYDSIENSKTGTDTEVKKLEKLESVSLAKEFKKVVAVADVILEVVDARDPLGTRCKIVEETVLKNPGKRLVIVVNKSDLVPRNILESWLTYLRGRWPAVPFKASVQQQSHKLGRRAMIKKWKKKKYLEKLMAVSSCVGGEYLMKILANYRKNKGINTTLTVGVVGMPNVGKSSVINSLKRSKSCKIGAEPGVTRNMQTVQISASIKILDSPGIVIEKSENENQAVLALKNVLNIGRLQDPMVAANVILQRATKEQMKQLYYIDDYSDNQEFLYLLAKRFGLLQKRGIPDTFKAARVLVSDWNRGKIRYYTLPPEDSENVHISSDIVSQVSKEFDIDTFKPEESVLLNLIEDTKENRVLYLNVSDQGESNVNSMEVDDANNVVIDATINTKKTGKLRWRKKNKITDDICRLPSGVSKLKRRQKMEAKKRRKDDARNRRRTEINVQAME